MADDLFQYGTVSGGDLSQYGTIAPAPVSEKSVGSRALANLPRSAARMIQQYAPGPKSESAPVWTSPDKSAWGNPLNPINAIPATIKSLAHPFLHPLESFAEDPLGTINAVGLAARGLAGVAKEMPNQIPSMPTVHPIIEHLAERVMHAPRGTIDAIRRAAGGGTEEAAAPAGVEYDPRFHGQTTRDAQFRGPVSPAQPYTPPAPTSWTQGTTGTPAQTPQGVVMQPMGGDFVPAGQGIPKPAPTGGTGGGPIPMPGNPAVEAQLKAQFPSRGAPADVAAGSIPPPKPVHEAAHAIDTHFSPRKAMNLTRHLSTGDTPMPYEEVEAMVNKAKQTGDWNKINDIEQKAWESGKALEASGAAKPGSLVPKTKYRPKTADYSDIKGIENTEGTWDRVLQTYPRTRPAITPQLTAPQPMGMLPPPVWPPQPPVPNMP